MSDSVKNKAITGVIWSGVDRVGGQLVRFGIGVVLARLLTPAEFGLIGMLTLFMGISQVFINCGFVEALIQKGNPRQEDLSSVFYLNIALGLVSALVLFACAPWIARFYDQPALVTLTRIMALDIVIGSFGVIQTMQLTKKLDFKTQMTISMITIVTSGLVAIVMALKGCGVISLAVQIVLGSLLRTLLLWLLHGWRPLPYFSLAALREMFPYGSRLFVSGLLNAGFNEIYSVVIGKLYSPAVLGLYTRARQLPQLPVDSLCSIVSRVSFPVFSSIQNDKEQLKRGVRKALKGLSWINFPLMVGLGVTAKPLVLMLLTEKWLDCVPFIQLLCVGSALYPLSLIHLNALSAQGRSDLFLRLEIVKKAIMVLVIAVSYRFGVLGMLYGSVFVSVVSLCLNAFYSVRLIGYGYKEQMLDMLPYACISAIMGVCVWLAGSVPANNNVIRLLVQVSTGVSVYAFICWRWRISSFVDAWEAVAARLPRWKSA